MAWFYLVLAGLNSCLGNLCLKYSRLHAATDALWWQKLLSPWFVAGLFFYVVNVVLFAKALDRLPVSIAYPVLAATGFALLTAASSFFFGERLSGLQYLGLALILGGIALMAVRT
jgi:multidrug transporter EmrE-like cation transporter